MDRTIYELQGRSLARVWLYGFAAFGFIPDLAKMDKIFSTAPLSLAPNSRFFVFGDLEKKLVFNISESLHIFTPTQVKELYELEVPEGGYHRVQMVVAGQAKDTAKSGLEDAAAKVELIDTPKDTLSNGMSAAVYANWLIGMIFQNYSLIIK